MSCPRSIWILCLLLLGSLNADIKSNSGNIAFDPDSNDSTDFIITSNGLGIKELSPQANLHLQGNAIISQQLSLGAADDTHTLSISGSMGLSAEKTSTNTTLLSVFWRFMI